MSDVYDDMNKLESKKIDPLDLELDKANAFFRDGQPRLGDRFPRNANLPSEKWDTFPQRTPEEAEEYEQVNRDEHRMSDLERLEGRDIDDSDT